MSSQTFSENVLQKPSATSMAIRDTVRSRLPQYNKISHTNVTHDSAAIISATQYIFKLISIFHILNSLPK